MQSYVTSETICIIFGNCSQSIYELSQGQLQKNIQHIYFMLQKAGIKRQNEIAYNMNFIKSVHFSWQNVRKMGQQEHFTARGHFQ